jgi:hypothetical protein
MSDVLRKEAEILMDNEQNGGSGHRQSPSAPKTFFNKKTERVL